MVWVLLVTNFSNKVTISVTCDATATVRRRRSAAGARLPPTVSPVGVRRSVGAFASGGMIDDDCTHYPEHTTVPSRTTEEMLQVLPRDAHTKRVGIYTRHGLSFFFYEVHFSIIPTL